MKRLAAGDTLVLFGVRRVVSAVVPDPDIPEGWLARVGGWLVPVRPRSAAGTTTRTEELRRLADETDERWPQIGAHNLKVGVPLPTLYALLDVVDAARACLHQGLEQGRQLHPRGEELRAALDKLDRP